VTNATSPGGYYIYDAEKKTANEIGQVRPSLARIRPGQVFAVGYSARDGRKISGYLTAPPGWTDKSPKPPLVVMPHGGPEVRDIYAYDPLVQFLASRGYAVFQPNYRGSAGYGREFQEAGLRHWADTVEDDITDGVKFLIDKGFADPARMCIYGASYGGYAALMGAVQHPELYKCAISASGPTDLTRMLKWERNEHGADSLNYKYWVSQIGDPGEDRALIEAASPALHADRVQHPVLLIHGKQDHTVPYEQSEFMLAALKKAGKEAQLASFETAAHGFAGRDQKRFFAELEAFLGANLGVPVVPPIGGPLSDEKSKGKN
jgi:dipeptidyl aminopeptidase/acylaminoacyl peptidase